MTVSASENAPHVWQVSVEEVATRYGSDLQHGLSQDQARQRLEKDGLNQLVEVNRRSAFQLFVRQFSNFMIIVLMIAAVVSGIVGEPVDAIAIVVIIILNAIIGFIQEYRAERALAALKAMASPKVRVRRDSHVQEIDSEHVVAGDVLVLEAGNYIPADGRIALSTQLQVDESALTGESVAVSKMSEILEDEAPILAERHNMLYRGTLITHGRGEAVVCSTGMNTEVGHIASLIQISGTQKTPLQKRLANFGRRLAIAILMICGLMLAAGVLSGEAPLLMFLTAVSLAVAAIPEALPAVVTVALGLGARRMVGLNALIRRLPAVETLGSTTVICSDKTGTLTQNKMHMEQVFVAGEGSNSLSPPESARGPWLLMAQAMAISNDVEFDEHDHLIGEPTEVALVEAALQQGFIKKEVAKKLPRIAELPFDAKRKCMTTFHELEESIIALTKGAPEKVIVNCRYQLGVDGVVPIDSENILSDAENLASSGYRVLAFAYCNWQDVPDSLESEFVERDLVFLGLVALLDPPREEAFDAVSQCVEAGIIPIMITGDHPSTAKAIAIRLGICAETEQVMTGASIAQLAPGQLSQSVLNYRVFARVSPEQKINIVNALQENGHFVAMTGDGVNDAPALKRADIGVAMGKQGTDVSREAADMVLLDDNFATIVAAVREGRRIYDNIRKFIKYTMTSNSGEIWTLFLAPFMGLPIPLLPIHILWINLVTDGLPGLALSIEKSERDIMKRRPRPPKESVFAHGMWQHILWIGLLIGFLSLFSQAWALNTGGHWQTVVFTVLTFSQLVHALSIRSERDSLFRVGLFSNPQIIGAILLTIGLQMMVIYVPLFNEIFKTQPLGMDELIVCFSLPWIVLVFVEIEKGLARRGVIYKNNKLTATG